MFSSLIIIPVVALLKYFKIIKKGSSPGGLGLSLSKKTRGKKHKNNGNDMGSVHRPLQAMESNTFSMATEFSDNMFKLWDPGKKCWIDVVMEMAHGELPYFDSLYSANRLHPRFWSLDNRAALTADTNERWTTMYVTYSKLDGTKGHFV